MPSRSNLENIVSQERSLHQRSAQSFDGEFVAKVFKYYRSLQNPYKSKSFPLKLVSGKALYNSYKELFDTFAYIKTFLRKYKIEKSKAEKANIQVVHQVSQEHCFTVC